jgi:hypothetical protein
VHATPLRPISLRAILILSTHLDLGLPSGLLPSGFLNNNLYAFLFSAFMLHAPPFSSSLTCYPNYTWQRVQIVKFHVMQFSSPSHHSVPLQSKYSSQHTIRKHPPSVFLNITYQILHPHGMTGKITALYILILHFTPI